MISLERGIRINSPVQKAATSGSVLIENSLAFEFASNEEYFVAKTLEKFPPNW